MTDASSTSGVEAPSTERPTPDAAEETAVQQLADHAEQVRRRELDTALSKLRSRGDLDAETRAVVEGLSKSLTAALLAYPEAVAAAADDATAERVADLLTPDSDE